MGPRLLEDAQLLIEHGWSVIRTTPGHPDRGGDETLFEPRESIGVTAEWLTRLREAVGPAPVLGIDYHHRLSVAEAASFCQRMPRGTLDFLEEPIRAESPEAYAALRSMTDVPFAIGEEFASKWAFLPFIEQGLTNFIRVDVCNVGGLTEADEGRRLGRGALPRPDAAQPARPDLHRGDDPSRGGGAQLRLARSPHVAHRAARLRQLGAVPGPAAAGGQPFPVPDAPGLGVEFDETKAAQQEFQLLGGAAPAPPRRLVHELVIG